MLPPRRAGGPCSVRTPVSWAPRGREEGETLDGANIQVGSAKLASRVLGFVLLFLGQDAVGLW